MLAAAVSSRPSTPPNDATPPNPGWTTNRSPRAQDSVQASWDLATIPASLERAKRPGRDPAHNSTSPRRVDPGGNSGRRPPVTSGSSIPVRPRSGPTRPGSRAAFEGSVSLGLAIPVTIRTPGDGSPATDRYVPESDSARRAGPPRWYIRPPAGREAHGGAGLGEQVRVRVL